MPSPLRARARRRVRSIKGCALSVGTPQLLTNSSIKIYFVLQLVHGDRQLRRFSRPDHEVARRAFVLIKDNGELDTPDPGIVSRQTLSMANYKSHWQYFIRSTLTPKSTDNVLYLPAMEALFVVASAVVLATACS